MMDTEFSDEKIKQRIRLGEDSHWEFKQIDFAGNEPKSPSRDSFANEISSFANTEGGVLLCGVSDSGKFQTMSKTQLDNLEKLLFEVCRDTIKPCVRPLISRQEIEAGKPFLLVKVPKGHTAHRGSDGEYCRVGSSIQRMTTDECLRLSQQRGQARFLWYDKQPVPKTSFSSIDEPLWKPLLSNTAMEKPKLALERMEFLVSEHGVTRATVAGVLLCSSTPEQWLPHACITATCYRGNDRSSGQVDSQTITGPVQQQIAAAVAFAVRNMRVGARKDPARTDLPQYSEEAIFEAIVNAVVHRDYSMHGSRIRLSLFADRLEISSPGSLPNNMTIESMAERTATRNELLATMLGRVPVGNIRGAGERQFFVERRGDGVTTIQNKTHALSGKKPEYRAIDNAELVLLIPAARTESTPATASVVCQHNGKYLSGVDLLVIFPNNTWQRATTDDNGEAHFKLHTTHLPMTVFAAKQDFKAQLEQGWVPDKSKLVIEMQSLPLGGAVIFTDGTGSLPGLTGQLNPIRDSYDRTYLYTANIAINDGRAKPVHFAFGEDLHLTDINGKELLVRIVMVVDTTALLEYCPYTE